MINADDAPETLGAVQLPCREGARVHDVLGGRDERPVVYLVDDEPQSGAAHDLDALGVACSWLHPLEVEPHHLQSATLLAIDEYFDLRADASLPAHLPLATVPSDGLSLAAVFRSASKKVVRSGGRPLGITLRTGKLDDLTTGLPRGVRQPLVAATHDLEWVVPKSDLAKNPLDQVAALAKALHSYPPDWSPRTARNVGLKWLSVPEAEWSDLARYQILQCRPPVEVAPSSQHGLAWVRWLAHRVLPFPTFLLSEQRTATLLGITTSGLMQLVEGNSDIAHRLKACVYTGPLEGLQERRFWRAGIHHLIRSLVDADDVDDPQVLADTICVQAADADPLGLVDPVVCIDREYQELAGPVERSSAERLMPDGWPVYADAAWGAKEDVDDGDMAELLAPRLS